MMQRRFAVRVAALCVAVVLAATARIVPGPAQAGTLSPDLSTRLEHTPADEPVRVLVFLREQAPIAAIRKGQKIRGAGRHERHRETVEALQAAAASQQPLVEALRAKHATWEVVHVVPYWIANLILLEAPPAVVTEVAARPDVEWIEPARRARLVDPAERPAAAAPRAFDERIEPNPPDGIRAIRAPEVWHRLGINGAGTLIANLDTGVNGDHHALRTRWRGTRPGVDWREAWFDPADSNHTFPEDPNSHGTHVMGTMTGRGTLTADTVGVAWGADWIASNAIMADESQDGGDPILDAFQWFADPDGDPLTSDDVPDVVQNSWGWSMTEPGYSPCDSHWWTVIDHCEAAGAVVIWSAGNDGPDASSILIPADRAETPTNVFSVGAVMATGTSFPYNVAPFSSRGPTHCAWDPALVTKPEVAAPGVNIYSTVPGGFQGGWSGTSMAGPHVAGIVALLRQANPDLDGDAIKVILMETARDLGRPGEDNESGWGFVDAYAAVLRAMTSFGRIEGSVRNGSVGGAPLSRAEVALLDTSYRFRGNLLGEYRGSAAAASYRAVARAEGFAPDTAEVSVAAGESTRHDFLLRDDTPPSVTAVDAPTSSTDSIGPYLLSFRGSDPSGLDAARLHYRRDQGSWTSTAAPSSEGRIDAKLPGARPETRYEYYLELQDAAGLVSTWPDSGAVHPAAFEVRRLLHREDFESHPAPGWIVGAEADRATSGLWLQAEPIATADHGRVLQPAEDRTPGTGRLCFITGNGEPGAPAGDADVDGGCTTLLSPVIDLSHEREIYLSWWYWLGKGGASADDTLSFDLSTDAGESWSRLDARTEADTVWQFAQYRLDESTPLTNRMRLRYRACDEGLAGVLEVGLDDVSIEAFLGRRPLPTPAPAEARLRPPAPNPCRGECRISFDLPVAGRVRLVVWDLLGRQVRGLYDGWTDVGSYTIPWDGRSDENRRVAAGVYFCRLDAPGVRASRTLLMLR